MAYIQNVELNWTEWKEIKSDLSASAYYLQNDLQYVPFVMDTTNSFIYFTGVNRDPSASGPYAALSSGVKASAVIQDITYTSNVYGASSITVTYDDIDATATGTVTVIDHTQLAGAVLSVNGVALTEGVQWSAATSNNATATSLAAAISTATVTTHSTGGAIGAVITVTANAAGIPGNYISLATSNATDLTISGNHLTGGVGGPGFESVSVSGQDITVHITSGVSTAQQVVTAVMGWSAYNSLNSYSAASAALVTAVVTGSSGNPQTTQGPTSLTGGTNAVTILADWTTNYLGSATLAASFMDGYANDL